MKRNWFWLALAVISVLPLLPNLSDFFVWDDFCLLEQSRCFTWRSFITPGLGGYFRPVPLVCYYLIGKASGLNPLGYHLASVMSHLINVGLLYALISSFTKDRRAALLAGLGFSIHFAQDETLLWISSLNEVLATSFGLLFLWTFWWSLEGKPHRAMVYVLSLFSLIFALASKESMMHLPLLATTLALLYSPKSRGKQLWLLCPPFLLLAGYLFLRAQLGAAMPTFTAKGIGAMTLSPFSVLSNYGHFLVSLIIPLRFFFDVTNYGAYERLTRLGSGESPLTIALIIALMIILFITVLLGRKLRPGKAFWVGGLWTLVALLPYVFYSGKGERFLYFASGGISLLAASLLGPLIIRRRALGVTLAVLLFVFGLCIRLERGRWWLQGGEISRTVLTDIKGMPASGPTVLLADIPARIHGAYAVSPCIGSAVQLFIPGFSREVLLVERDEFKGTEQLHPDGELYVWRGGHLIAAAKGK
jgi:hypothetical protein